MPDLSTEARARVEAAGRALERAAFDPFMPYNPEPARAALLATVEAVVGEAVAEAAEYPSWFRPGCVYVPVTTPNGRSAVVDLDRSVWDGVRVQLAMYRAWGNGPATASTVAATGAEALTRLDALAQACDRLLDALDGGTWAPAARPSAPEVGHG